MQAEAAVCAFAFFPASQLTHAVLLALRVSETALSVMTFPDGQLVQLVEAVAEYFPKAHVMQDIASVWAFALFPA